ncbi:DNA repair protein [Mesobaculum littorinae]|uniref:DNA repair protein n=1 Tax=Mesobaculum littorinae TaxID=2486419 RepID=A0A438AMI3_9RHOB|nr:DNA repair protein [Mesobaculum littorinae]RVV99892.1 DNA repair protein [Mesobaculum littorinae]
MSGSIRQVRGSAAQQAHWIASAILTLAAIALVSACIAAAAGLLPWLTLPLTFGEVTYPQAGLFVQLGVTALIFLLACSMPSGLRVLRLEQSHRDFSICMSDVAEAYRICHAADREGAFTLKGEFDAVRERIRFMRSHPDLGGLEPQILEAAAQMSTTSQELADRYSDEKIDRARTFLRQRQEEIETFRDRIVEATAQCHELRRWVDHVEVEESIMESQLGQLEEQLGDTLAKLGFVRSAGTPNVVPMKSGMATAAE